MARVSTDLQNIVLKLRMVPVESVFNRFPRMVRDLAKILDKKVNLIITGAETELDRTVIDEIGDPLVHLLRNSLDHGLEPPEDKTACGKPETGNIHLRAFHSGNHVFIEIEDDGRGIDRDKVLQISGEAKIALMNPEEARTDERRGSVSVSSLLRDSARRKKFPTFPAAESASMSSRSKITSLGGQVSVHPQAGIGTQFYGSAAADAVHHHRRC